MAPTIPFNSENLLIYLENNQINALKFEIEKKKPKQNRDHQRTYCILSMESQSISEI